MTEHPSSAREHPRPTGRPPFDPIVARRNSRAIRARQRLLCGQLAALRGALGATLDALEAWAPSHPAAAEARMVLAETDGDPNEGVGSAHRAGKPSIGHRMVIAISGVELTYCDCATTGTAHRFGTGETCGGLA